MIECARAATRIACTEPQIVTLVAKTFE